MKRKAWSISLIMAASACETDPVRLYGDISGDAATLADAAVPVQGDHYRDASASGAAESDVRNPAAIQLDGGNSGAEALNPVATDTPGPAAPSGVPQTKAEPRAPGGVATVSEPADSGIGESSSSTPSMSSGTAVESSGLAREIPEGTSCFPSDDDACPCYLAEYGSDGFAFCVVPASYEQATAQCEAFEADAHLARVDNQALHDWLVETAARIGDYDWWIGASDAAEEGTFRWAEDGTELDYTAWHDGEPNQEGDEDCVGIRKGLWNDFACGSAIGFICDK